MAERLMPGNNPVARRWRTLASAAGLGLLSLAAACGDGGADAGPASAIPAGNGQGAAPAGSAVQHILFVGDSLTHGRYAPVRQYHAGGTEMDATGSASVVDENVGQTGARAERETGPWGGIPGLFAAFAAEKGLPYDVHIEAISATSLAKNYAAAPGVVAQAKWNAVVLQEISTRPLPASLSQDSTSDPAQFCASVRTIEAAVHQAAAGAAVYLYETWPSGDLARQLSGRTDSDGFATRYAANLAAIGAAYHDAYYSAAQQDGRIAAVAPAGEAWMQAWSQGVANANPFGAASPLPLLWYGRNAVNDPAIADPDYLHPSVQGAYLSALVLFQRITGTDVRSLGGNERAAIDLGIDATTATALQRIAYQTVTGAPAVGASTASDPCR